MSPATATRNIENVKLLYAAFERGDVPAILDRVAENVDWNHQAQANREMPWNADFSGRNKLSGFFLALQQHAEFTVFEPKDFMSDERHVAVHLRVEFILKKNGRTVANDSIHFWTFDEAGQVTRYRHFVDSAAELAAWRG